MNKMYSAKVKPHLKRISMLSMCGSSVKDIASFLGISEKTLRKYAKEFPELDKALNEKKNSDIKVMEAFFKRACGYTAEEETCEFKGKKNSDGDIEDEQVVRKTTKKDVPPDLGAIKWWLENSGGKNPEADGEPELEEARELLLERQRLLEENQ